MSDKNSLYEDTLKGLKQALQIENGEIGIIEIKKCKNSFRNFRTEYVLCFGMESVRGRHKTLVCVKNIMQNYLLIDSSFWCRKISKSIIGAKYHTFFIGN